MRGAADVVTYGDLEHLKAVIARELAAGAARRRLAELSEPSTPAGIAKFIGLGAGLGTGLGAGATPPQAEARPGEEPLTARARAVQTVGGLKIDRRREPAAALTLAERARAHPGADEGTQEAIAPDYIRRRIQAGGLALEYQPIAPIEQAHRSPPMYEVLLRLRDERGLLLPARRILPALARGGLLPRVDVRVFHVALPILAHVQQRDRLEVRFYVNLAAETLSQPEALQAIIALIATVAIRPGSLVVEVAKSCLASPDLLRPLCDCLLEHGHSLAMKGFEPEDCEFLAPRLDWVRQVKINPDVVERMGRASEARKVTAAVRWLQERDVAVIGMAVDHPQLLSRLRELEVDAVQGYFVGMPAMGLHLPTVEDIGVDPWPLGAP